MLKSGQIQLAILAPFGRMFYGIDSLSPDVVPSCRFIRVLYDRTGSVDKGLAADMTILSYVIFQCSNYLIDKHRCGFQLFLGPKTPSSRKMSIVQTVHTFKPTPTLERDQPRNAFTNLIDALSSKLGTSGIDPEDTDIAAIEALMHSYTSDPAHWTPHVRSWTEPDAPYVRNTVDGGNGKYNLVRPHRPEQSFDPIVTTACGPNSSCSCGAPAPRAASTTTRGIASCGCCAAR